MTLRERIRECADRVIGNIPHNIDLLDVAFAIADIADELEGKVAVTPKTYSPAEGVWVTEVVIRGVGSSPDDSRAKFDEMKGE